MSKLTKQQRETAYELCKKRDGHRCRRCRKGPKTVGPLKVDHLNNDPSSNPASGKNWQLLCHSCNIKKNPRGPGRRGIDARHRMLYIGKEGERERERGRDIDVEDGRLKGLSPEMKKNMECEWRFRDWLTGMLTEMGVLTRADVIDGGAEYLTKIGFPIMQQALGRYLDKMTSFIGELELFSGDDGRKYIRFKQTGKAGLSRRDDTLGPTPVVAL